MAKSMNIEKIKIMPVKCMRKVQGLHHRKAFDRIVEKGKDKDGRQFKPYSQKYREIKGRDYKRKRDGKRYKGFENIPLSTQTSPPNFQLTYKTMRNFKRLSQITKHQYGLGWSGEAAKIVHGNKDRGRDVLGVPKDEIKWVVKKLMPCLDKHMQKTMKNINITIG